jgi:DNA invertase Pin-like site-specific DNA recombinase
MSKIIKTAASIIQKFCVIYVRVSSTDQLEGTSLESQERMCREYSERLGWTVLAVFIERGESAKTANRTEFNKAIRYCKDNKNKVSGFVVYKLDRFARRLKDYTDIKEKLRQFGTELVSATEPLSNGPAGIALEQMLSVFAEFDNNVRRERTVQGMQERLAQGVWVWQCLILKPRHTLNWPLKNSLKESIPSGNWRSF